MLFSGFLQFKSNFVDGQSNSKYGDGAPLSLNGGVGTLMYYLNRIGVLGDLLNIAGLREKQVFPWGPFILLYI